jgi:hypothetical protein
MTCPVRFGRRLARLENVRSGYVLRDTAGVGARGFLCTKNKERTGCDIQERDNEKNVTKKNLPNRLGMALSFRALVLRCELQNAPVDRLQVRHRTLYKQPPNNTICAHLH